jgi:hypothetical protein
MEPTQATIKITITQAGAGQLTSVHELENIDPFTAAMIMLDVARDILRDHHRQPEASESVEKVT